MREAASIHSRWVAQTPHGRWLRGGAGDATTERDRGDSLDYVVFGIGFGATLLVLGLLVRDVGPRLRYRTPTNPEGIFHAEELVARVSWSRFCGALGTVLALAGAAFLLITVVSMFLMLSDATGGLVMGISLLILFLLVAFWTWAFFDRFGSYGILPEREEMAPDTETSGAPDDTEPATNAEAKPEATAFRPSNPEDVRTEHRVDTSPDPDADVRHLPTEDTEPESSQVADAGAETMSDQAVEQDEPEPSHADQRLETPEERMAGSDSPIDHGSLEGDLGMPASSAQRPSPRARSRRREQPPRNPSDPETPAARPDERHVPTPEQRDTAENDQDE